MLQAHRSLLLGQALGGFALNVVLNGVVAYLTFPPVAKLPLWARGNCVAGDTIGTGFFLPLMTCLVLTTVVRRMRAAARIEAVERTTLPFILRLLPRNVVLRGMLGGLLTIVLCALPTLLLLTVLGIDSMSRGEVTLYKAIYTGLLGVLVTPLLGWRALAD